MGGSTCKASPPKEHEQDGLLGRGTRPSNPSCSCSFGREAAPRPRREKPLPVGGRARQRNRRFREPKIQGWLLANRGAEKDILLRGHPQNHRCEQAQEAAQRGKTAHRRETPLIERAVLPQVFTFTACDAPLLCRSCRCWMFSHDAAERPAKAPRRPRSQRVCGREW